MKPVRACVNLEKVRANAKAQCLELVNPALSNMESAEKRQGFCECAADLTVNQFETNMERASTHMDWASARAACEK